MLTWCRICSAGFAVLPLLLQPQCDSKAMMTLPEGFDVSLLVADFSAIALPLVGIALIVSVAALINRVLRIL